MYQWGEREQDENKKHRNWTSGSRDMAYVSHCGAFTSLRFFDL
jgi:hypothetical protein